MNKILLALAVAVLAAGPVAASDKTDVMVPVNQFVDAFNKGDAKAVAGFWMPDGDYTVRLTAVDNRGQFARPCDVHIKIQ